jgi:hypothetical protein
MASPYDPVTVAPQGVMRVAASTTAEYTATPGTYVFPITSTQQYPASADVALVTNLTYVVNALPPPPPADTTKPSVNITSPYNGQIVFRGSTVTIRATASDNVGVTQMVYRTNNGATTICSGGPSLTSCNWVPTQRGQKTVTVTAFDAAGNSRTASVLVNVL